MFRDTIMGGFEITDRNDRRAEVAAGGWTILWGDLINEADVVQLVVNLGTATPALWVQQQVTAQLVKFSQSLNDVSDDVINHATTVPADALEH